METSNEALLSANEALRSANEALRNTNQELETSKEEQQSLDTELDTVNAELHQKSNELTSIHNDMQSLLNSIQLPAIFLDHNLCIKRFTASAVKVANLIPSDVGRPLSDIVTRLKYANLIQDAKSMIEDLIYREKEVQTKDGIWYLMRILPYRTAANAIAGVLITFQDISDRKIGKHLRQMAAFIDKSNDAITVQDFEGNILAWNSGAARIYGWSEHEALSMNIFDLVPEDMKTEALKFAASIKLGRTVKPLKTRRIAKNGDIVAIRLTASKLIGGGDVPHRMATIEQVLDSRK